MEKGSKCADKCVDAKFMSLKSSIVIHHFTLKYPQTEILVVIVNIVHSRVLFANKICV